jgi:hypothetical protein
MKMVMIHFLSTYSKVNAKSQAKLIAQLVLRIFTEDSKAPIV